MPPRKKTPSRLDEAEITRLTGQFDLEEGKLLKLQLELEKAEDGPATRCFP